MTAPIESSDLMPEPRRWSDLAAELGYDDAVYDDDGSDDETVDIDDIA